MPTASLHGKICYLEIPSTNIQRSAEFYSTLFGWTTRTRDDGSVAFDDSTGQVSGSYLLTRKPSTEVGTLIYIMVDDAEATVVSIPAAGGEVVQPIGRDAPEITARFRDPDGNLFGIYQEPV